MCRFCRMHTCLAAGMLISEVKSSGAITPASDHPSSSSSPALIELSPTIYIPDNVLGDLLKARRAIFYDRVRCGMFKSKDISAARNTGATILSMLHLMSTEAQVCLNYLQSSKIMDYFGGGDNVAILMRHFLPTWAKMETFQNTAKNGGVSINRIYCLNEEYIDLEMGFLEKFYKAEPSLSNPKQLANVEQSYYYKMLCGAKSIVDHELDDYEFAALVQLTLISIAVEVLPDAQNIRARLQPYQRALMNALQKHYNENYGETAVRLGNLILLIGEMQQHRRIYNERVIVLDMSSVWPTGPGAYDHSPYDIQKEITQKNKSDSENLWLPICVPLELSITDNGKDFSMKNKNIKM
uniref:NR LBD domain-containing protein n=1 Tax=Panagrolaimus sp. ES5 TaxID=591445 RepID=A0AC34GRB8_9BILA